MDNTEPKKWFTHNGSQQLGPLTQSEILQQLKQGQLQKSHFAWCEGMPQWAAISSISELNTQTPAFSQPPTPSRELSALIEISHLPKSELQEKTSEISVRKTSSGGLRKIAILLFIIGILGLLIFIFSNDSLKTSLLKPFVKNLPKVAELSESENQTLLSVLSIKPDKPAYSFIVKEKKIYFSTNQEENSTVSLTLKGFPHTLVGATTGIFKKNFSTKEHLAETEPLNLPTGEYQLTLQPGVFSERIFLGGEKNQKYLDDLKAYHDELLEKLKKEIVLFNQGVSSLSEFTKLSQLDLDQVLNEKNLAKLQAASKNYSKKWETHHYEWLRQTGDLKLETLKQNLTLWKQAQKLLLLKQMFIQIQQKQAEISSAAGNGPNLILSLRNDLKLIIQTKNEAIQEFEALIKVTEEKINTNQWIQLVENDL